MGGARRLYLSYSLADIMFALKFATAAQRVGLPLWMDRLNIHPGDDRFSTIQKGIDGCTAVIALYSRDYVQSPYCKRELSYAQRQGIPIMPLLLEEGAFLEDMEGLVQMPFEDFISWDSDEIFERCMAQFSSLACEVFDIPLADIPDEEQRYLNQLIIQLESRRGLNEKIGPAQQDAGILNDNFIRPRPTYITHWNEGTRFIICDQSNAPSQAIDRFEDLLIRYPRMIVIGPAGSGKSALLAQHILGAAHTRKTDRNGAMLPIYTSLMGWDGQQSIVDFIAQQSPFLAAHDGETLLTGEGVQLWLDDLDWSDTTHRDNLLDWLQSETAPARVMIAARAADIHQLELPCDEIPVVLLKPLNPVQIAQFITTCLPEVNARMLLEHVLVDQFNDTDYFHPIASNLYWLSALILAARNIEEADISLRPLDICQQLVAQFWDQSRRYQLTNVRLADIRPMLERLAFAFIDQSTGSSITRPVVAQTLTDDNTIEAALRASLLHMQGEYLVFCHTLLQQFFAANQLSDAYIEALIHPLEADARPSHDALGRWEGAIRFYVAQRQAADELVLAIANVDPMLALRCLADGADVNTDTRDSVVNLALAATNGSDNHLTSMVAELLLPLVNDTLLNTLLIRARDGDLDSRMLSMTLIQQLAPAQFPGLLQALLELDTGIRPTIATAVRTLGAAAVPNLLRTLCHSNWKMRRGAAWALAQIRDRAAVPGLIACLDDQDPLVVKEAIIGLGEIGDMVALHPIIERLQHRSWMVNQAAAQVLAVFGEPAQPLLLDVLESGDSNARILALSALSTMDHPDVVRAILRTSYDVDIEVRAAAIQALQSFDKVDVIKRLMDCMADTTFVTRRRQRICDIAVELLKGAGLLEQTYDVDRWRQESGIDRKERLVNTLRKLEESKSQNNSSASLAKERLKRVTRNRPDASGGRDEPEETTPDSAPSPISGDTWRDQFESAPIEAKIAMIRGLAANPTQDELDMLGEMLLDTDRLVSDVALQTLEGAGSAALMGLHQLIESDDPRRMIAAMEVMSTSKHPDSVPVLIACLDDTRDAATPRLKGRICDVAARALIAIRSPEAIQAVAAWRKRGFQSQVEKSVQQHTQQPEAQVKKSVQEHTQQPEAQTPSPASRSKAKEMTRFIEAIRTGSWDEQQTAAIKLRESARQLNGTGSKAVRDLLITALDDAQWPVRWAATEALAWLGDRNVTPHLVGRVKDENWMVRIAALRALVEIGDTTIQKEIALALQDRHASVREVAAEALGALGDPTIIDDLARAAMDPDEFVRLAVVEALARIGGEQSTALLLRALMDVSSHVRWSGARALSGRASAEHVGELTTHLLDRSMPQWEELRVCDWIAQALERIATPEALRALENWKHQSTTKS